jgi:hypothetical protein
LIPKIEPGFDSNFYLLTETRTDHSHPAKLGTHPTLLVSTKVRR